VDLGPGIAYGISDAAHIVGTAPSGLLDVTGEFEVWQAFLWRGTGGVQPSAFAARVGTVPVGRTSACFAAERNWQSKMGMFRCLAGRKS
jgi:hypothetical protein